MDALVSGRPPLDSAAVARPSPGPMDVVDDALGRLFDRVAPDLVAVALRICGSLGEAEDVVEQTLLEAWGMGEDAVAHPARLVRRCRSLALVRSGKRSIEVTRRSPFSAGHRALDDGTRAAAARALQRLGADESRLAAMACFEGYSVTEIAARTHTAGDDVLTGLGRLLDLAQAGEDLPGSRVFVAPDPSGIEAVCVLHAFDLLEGEARERIEARLRAGDPALAARLAARERALALLALSAPPARPGPGLRGRLLRAAAGGSRV